MTDPQSNAPGALERTDHDEAAQAVARMLDAPEKAMVVIRAMAAGKRLMYHESVAIER